MSATMKSININVTQSLGGPQIVTETLAATGLTPNSANTVPFPKPLPLSWPLFRVLLTPVGNGAAGALVSLDTSQGDADPTNSLAGGKLGWDRTNVYLYIGNASQLLVIVEYAGQ